MAFRYGNRTQLSLLPNCIDDYVTDDDPVRVYDAFVEALNIHELGIDMNHHVVGSPSYDPVTMLKILVYGYSYGWRSSRKLERALHHNLSFIWLAGNLKPDHKTISNFRKNNKQGLKEVLKQCARLCMNLGLIEGNTLFVDGSKFRANAGMSQTKSGETWGKYHKQVEDQIEALFEECNRLDESEKGSLVKINKELKSKEALKSKIDQLLEQINEPPLDKPKKASPSPCKHNKPHKINGTDPDCKLMKGRQGSHACYNSQIVTDEQHSLVVSLVATKSTNDLNQLSTQVAIAEQTIGKPAQNICADAGYSSVGDLKKILDEGKVVIVPTSRQVQKGCQPSPHAKQAFTYDTEKDSYTCPCGHLLERLRADNTRNRIAYKIKGDTVCSQCNHFGTCTTAKSGRVIYRLKNEKTKQQLEKTYESKEGQQIYIKRKMKVEHPLGHIKRNLGAGAFLLRGTQGVNAELSLLGSCFNIARLITIAGGVKPLLYQLKMV